MSDVRYLLPIPKSPTDGLRPVRVYALFSAPGSPKPERRVIHERGAFHGFSLDVEEDEQGFSSYAVAIVELPDGSVIAPCARNIQFLDVEAQA